MDWVRSHVFRFWENRTARNWGLSIGFLLVVPVGARFASIAWKYGNLFDQIAVVVAGGVIGVMSVVVLLRVWLVPPVRTLPDGAGAGHHLEPHHLAGPDFLAAGELARLRSARNSTLGKEAAALGPVKRAPF
ncbi:MAG TPA: hypothetical protein VMU19_08540 [Bryobacteraceae bacterium]|nr:hypothetical protein [Bryobacteraceae bacterium]